MKQGEDAQYIATHAIGEEVGAAIDHEFAGSFHTAGAAHLRKESEVLHTVQDQGDLPGGEGR